MKRSKRIVNSTKNTRKVPAKELIPSIQHIKQTTIKIFRGRLKSHLAETGRNAGSQGLIQERGVQHPRQRHKSDGDFEIQNTSPKVRVPRHKPAGDLEHGGVISADDELQDMVNILVMGMSPMHGDGFEQVLSDDDGLAASTVSLATVRSKDFVGANAGLCVPRQKAVRERDFFDVNPRVCSQNSAGELDSEIITACNQVETSPVRHCPLRRLWKWWSSTLLHMRHLLP